MSTDSQPPAPGIDDDEISLLDLAETLAERFWLLILGPLIVGSLALGVAFVIPPTFTGKTVVMQPQGQQSTAAALVQSLGALSGLAGAAAGIKNPSDQIVSLLKSRTLSDRIIDRFDLMVLYKSKLREDAYKTLADNIRIKSNAKDGLVTIEVDDKDPKRAADMANAYIEELSRLMGRLAMTEAQARRMFFEKQLKESKDNLTQAEIALKAGGIEADVYKRNPQAAVTAVAQLQAQIAVQEVKLGAMRGYVTDAAPEFRQALIELQALRTQLGKLESTERVQPGGATTDYITRYRDYKYYETLFELLAKQYEIARVDESRERTEVQVVDPAVVPERKSKPKRALIAIIAALATGFLLVLYVFIRKALSNAAQDSDTAVKLGRIRGLLSWRGSRPA